MTKRKTLKSVLHNFLGIYTSRYSEYDGYWLFGFLVDRLESTTFDLLVPHRDESRTPLDIARRLAALKFAEQLNKAGLHSKYVTEARLSIERRADDDSVPGHHFRNGYILQFRAIAAAAGSGRHFSSERVIFVAPHDPRLEQQSARR